MSDVLKRLHAAQRLAVDLFDAIEARGLIQPGILESEASHRIHELAGEEFDGPRWWHRRVVRAGENTLHPYQEHPPDRTIQADDIVFVDLGPVFDGWEADFGRTYVLGDDPHKHALRDAVNAAYERGRAFVAERSNVKACEIWEFMDAAARESGYEFRNFYCGHLVGEFPHAKIPKHKLRNYLCADNDAPIKGTYDDGTPIAWILESHLVDRTRGYGGFVEGLLEDPKK